jgi:hypothetical protein
VKKNALESVSSIRDRDTALAPLLFYKSYNHFVTGALLWLQILLNKKNCLKVLSKK